MMQNRRRAPGRRRFFDPFFGEGGLSPLEPLARTPQGTCPLPLAAKDPLRWSGGISQLPPPLSRPAI